MRPLTIAVDASRTTAAQRTGTENYALQLIRAMLALDSPHRLVLYFRDEPPADLFPAADKRVIPWPRLWTHSRFAAALWQDRPDFTFVPSHVLPLSFPGPAAVTVLGINSEDRLADARRFLVDYPTTFPSLRDPGPDSAKAFMVRSRSRRSPAMSVAPSRRGAKSCRTPSGSATRQWRRAASISNALPPRASPSPSAARRGSLTTQS